MDLFELHPAVTPYDLTNACFESGTYRQPKARRGYSKEKTHSGIYCVRSNETDWHEGSLWRIYFMLTDVKAVFR